MNIILIILLIIYLLIKQNEINKKINKKLSVRTFYNIIGLDNDSNSLWSDNPQYSILERLNQLEKENIDMIELTSYLVENMVIKSPKLTKKVVKKKKTKK